MSHKVAQVKRKLCSQQLTEKVANITLAISRVTLYGAAAEQPAEEGVCMKGG